MYCAGHQKLSIVSRSPGQNERFASKTAQNLFKTNTIPFFKLDCAGASETIDSFSFRMKVRVKKSKTLFSRFCGHEKKIYVRNVKEFRMNYQCPTEFNVVTNLKRCGIYKKELQESTDPLKYMFDIKPGPMCYMPGQMFQGLQMTTGEKRPPPQLLDMELTLQAMPLKEAENDYIIKDIHSAKPPSMPTILSNRLVIPDCSDILKTRQTKSRWDEQPDVPTRMEKKGFYNTKYMRPGDDTKREYRDKFAIWEKTQRASQDVYGVGVYDTRPLKPGTNPKCNNADSELGCMHVYGPDASRTSKVIDPTMTVRDLAAHPGGPGDFLDPGTTIAASGQLVAPDTKRVAESIDPTVPFATLMRDPMTRAACNARFYNYNPPC
jgi:hypothetical protein